MAETRTKLAIFGESTTSGFGVRERSFGSLIARQLGLELRNCAGFGATIKDSIAALDAANDSAVVIAMSGINEAIVRPTERSLRFVPARYRRSGWMDPRAYFPTDWKRALPKRIESAIRWRVKVLLIRLTGGSAWVELEEFRDQHRLFIRELKRRGVPAIVLVGPSMVDERFFPGTPERMARFDEVVREQAREEAVIYVSAIEVLRRWEDYFRDHLHSSESGHRRIAEAISAQLELATTKPQVAPSAQPEEFRERPLASAKPQTDAAERPANT